MGLGSWVVMPRFNPLWRLPNGVSSHLRVGATFEPPMGTKRDGAHRQDHSVPWPPRLYENLVKRQEIALIPASNCIDGNRNDIEVGAPPAGRRRPYSAVNASGSRYRVMTFGNTRLLVNIAGAEYHDSYLAWSQAEIWGKCSCSWRARR